MLNSGVKAAAAAAAAAAGGVAPLPAAAAAKRACIHTTCCGSQTAWLDQQETAYILAGAGLREKERERNEKRSANFRLGSTQTARRIKKMPWLSLKQL